MNKKGGSIVKKLVVKKYKEYDSCENTLYKVIRLLKEYKLKGRL